MNAGLDGSNAGTALRASLLALNNPAKAQEKIMKQIGFTMQDSEGKTKSLSEIVGDLSASLEGMTEADKVATLAKLVGTEAVSGFLSLIKAGPPQIDAMSESLRNSAGASAEAAAKMKAGIGGALENLSGAFESLTIMIGDQLVPYVEKVAEWLTQLADKFMSLSDGTKQFLVVGTAIVGIFSAIGAAIGIAMVIFGQITGALTTLAGAMGIAGGAGGLLSAVFAALTGPIGIAIASITALVAAIVIAYKKIDWFRDMVNAAWAKIKELTVIAFNAIKKAISDAIAAVLAFAKPQLDKFKAFWEENGKAITGLVKTAFSAVQVVIQSVMGIIKGVFQTVWPIIANTVKVTWDVIKLAVTTAINIVLGVIQTVLKVLQGDWKGAWETIKKTVSSIWNDIVKFLKGIDLAEIGKDIIRGLVKGLSSMADTVVKAVKDLVDLIPEWMKKILGIHSPSRVTTELAEHTGQGVANGMINKKGEVKAAITSLMNIIKDVTKQNAKEVAQITSDAEKERTEIQKDAAAKRAEVARNSAESIAVIQASANKKTGKLTSAQALRIQNIRKDAAAKVVKIEADKNAQLTKINDKVSADMVKKEQEVASERLAAIKAFVDDKKSLDQLSLVAEAEVWRQSVAQFKVGTTERVKAQQEYQKSLKAVNDEIVRINDEYAGRMTEINERLRKQEEDLTKEYTDSLDKRMSSLMSFAGLFDEFDVKVEKSGAELLANLNAQVDGFKTWQSEIEKLSGKAIDEGLLAELRAMGPKALPELLALNSLTDTQLTQYSALYAEKSKLARTQAEAELVGMKEDTAKRITELRATANTELATLQTEWTAKIKGVTQATNDEFKSLTQIGINAGQNLLDGLASMESALVAQATAIAQAVNAALQSSLGGSVKVDPYKAPTTSTGTTKAVSSTSTTTPSKSSGVTQNITINSTTPLSPAEIARKNKQAAQQLAMEWR